MKKLTLLYGISTGIIAFLFALSSYLYLSQDPALVANMQQLGYPVHLLTLLGTAKLLGAFALVLPKYPRITEWAYAGFVFNLIGAMWSHAAVGDVTGALLVLAPLAILLISYITFKKRLPAAETPFVPALAPLTK